MELLNIHPGTIEEMYKIASINLSPNTMGQVLILRWRIPDFIRSLYVYVYVQ